MNYIFLSRDGTPLSIADRLQDDGKEVVVGLIPAAEGEKTGKDKQDCLEQLYEGILDVHKAEDVLKWMERLKNKEDWFVMFDFGDTWEYSKRTLEMGFTKGVFPTEKGYALECDRKAGKAFAKANYPRIKVAPAHEFKKADDAIKFLGEQNEKIFVLKSEGSNAETVVPLTQDFDLARKQVIGALKCETAGYELEGFTLEEKIPNAVELSPVLLTWNGKPLFTLIELENKSFGAGMTGRLTGGCQNLTIRTPFDCELNRIAFPPIVFETAKKQPGIGIYDCGLLYDGRDFYFTEFAGQRWGFPGLFSEITMCGDETGKGSVVNHFEGIVAGKNPLRFRYGAAVRLFQTQPDKKRAGVYADGYSVDWLTPQSGRLFFHCIRKEEEDDEPMFVSVGYAKDLADACGAADNASEAVDRAYEAADGVVMTGIYYRPKFDFKSPVYFSSIWNRLDFLSSSGLIE